MKIKKLARRIIGEKGIGYIDYFRYPEMKNKWGGAFNGQDFRKRIFYELMEKIKFSAIIETGTYKGTTTSFMARESGLPVYSVEIDPRNYGYARMRFLGNRRIKLFQDDSLRFLKKCARMPALSKGPVFFYLDAHWQAYLPLREELDIILDKWKKPVIMIDDFRVPGDDGYQYDDYSEGRELCMDYLDRLDAGLSFFFPSIASELETGKRRGCTVISSDHNLTARLMDFDTLVCHSSN